MWSLWVPAFVYYNHCNHMSWFGSWCGHNNIFSTLRPEEGLCVSACFLLCLCQNWSLTENSTVRSVYMDPHSKLFQQFPLAYVGLVAKEGDLLFAAMKWTGPGAGKVSCWVLVRPLVSWVSHSCSILLIYNISSSEGVGTLFTNQGFSTSNEVHIATWKHFTKFY